jgi:hypothetical protein
MLLDFSPAAAVVAVFSPAVLAGAVLSLRAAGCGSSSPGSSRSAAASAQARGLVPYASCMRSHRVPGFPDPTSSGGIPKDPVIS